MNASAAQAAQSDRLCRCSENDSPVNIAVQMECPSLIGDYKDTEIYLTREI